MRRPDLAVAVLFGIVLLGASLRFIGLGHQSYWYDEISTVDAIVGTPAHVFSSLKLTEATPPLYYLLGWGWRHVFGVHEFGLRSLSALAGTATIPLAWAAARELGRARAGLVAAALVATNPMLIWYSQEARAYALMAFLAAGSLWLCLRARRELTGAHMAAWVACAVLLLLTHYFGVFVVAAEAGLLVWVGRHRLALVTAALLPIALTGVLELILFAGDQKSGRPTWIASVAITSRLGDVLHELGTANAGLISSNSSAPHWHWGLVALVGLVVLLVGCFVAGDRRLLRLSLVPLTIALATVGVPFLLGAGPVDYFKDRNLIAAWLPFAVAMGVAAAAIRRPAWRWIGVGLVMLSGLAVTAQVGNDLDLQRAAWRQALTRLGPPRSARAIIVKPDYNRQVIDFYGHSLIAMTPGVPVSEIDLIGPEAPPPGRPLGLPSGFRVIRRWQLQQVVVDQVATPPGFSYSAAQQAGAGYPVYLEPSLSAQRWVTTYIRALTGWESDLRRGRAGRYLLARAEQDIETLTAVPADLPTAPHLLKLIQAAAARAAAYAQTGDATSRQEFTRTLRIAVAG